MNLIAKNQDSQNILNIYINAGKSIQVPAGGQVDLLVSCTRKEISDSDVPYHIEQDNIILNDGVNDLTKLKALRLAFDAPPEEGPSMADGRPIVRADTRPLDTQTYFTMAGDTASGIGDGTRLCWDFSNDDDVVECDYYVTPDGYKTKHVELEFIDPIYLKDGTLYFFDAPWGEYCDMQVVVPAGNYYPNAHGSIPASALGLPGTDMYSYAATDTVFVSYVNKQHMYGDCPMGDELNAEGAAVSAIPVGWYIVGHITTVSGDNTSKGYASFECYRHRTVLLPGDTP